MTANPIVEHHPPGISAPTVIKLGSGHASHFGVGSKGRLLDKAASRGLPVPEGYILLDSVWQFAIQADLLDFGDDGITCKDAQALYDAINLPAFPDKTTVAVRSAFTIEDTPSLSMAGYFTTVTHVDPTDVGAFVTALCDVWASTVSYDDIRRDVIIMQMVEAEHAGVMFTETNYEMDRVNYVEGTGEALLSGEVEGQDANIRRLRGYERGDREEGMKRSDATFLDRLQVLSRRARGVFGENSWDIEFADDGTTCYMLQIRRVTAPTIRNETFTLANHKEILPPLPSRYMATVIESCADGLYDWYRQFDSEFPRNRPFIELFKGRPYINLSLLTETMQALGLPTNLVTDNIGGDEGDKSGLRIRRAFAKLPTLAQLGMSQLSAVSSAEKTAEAIIQRSQNPGYTFGELAETMQWMYTALVHEMFNLTQAMSLPLVQLRSSGKLEELGEVTRTISTQIYDDLQPLREYVVENPKIVPELEKGELPEDPEFNRLWGLYLAKHGHRGIYESDIARPRFGDDPSPLLRLLTTDSFGRAASGKSDDSLGLYGETGTVGYRCAGATAAHGNAGIRAGAA